MKKTLIVFVSILMLLSGCEKKQAEIPPVSHGRDITDEAALLDYSLKLDGGVLNLVGFNGSIVTFFDDKMEEFLPLCTKADCSHEPLDLGCTAALLGETCCGKLGIYHDKLWYWKYVDLDRSILCCADLSGENEEELFEVDVFATGNGPDVFYGGYLYKIDAKNKFDNMGMFAGFEERIVRIDLETGKLMEIKKAEEVKIAEYRCLGAYGGKIFYQRNDIEDNEFQILTYDCENEKFEEYPIEGTLGNGELAGHYFAYRYEKDGEIRLKVLDLKREKEIGDFQIHADGAWLLFEDEVLAFSAKNGCKRFDIAIQEITQLDVENVSIICETNYGYILGLSSDGITMDEYGYLSKEDFQNGEEPKILTEGGIPIR